MTETDNNSGHAFDHLPDVPLHPVRKEQMKARILDEVRRSAQARTAFDRVKNWGFGLALATSVCAVGWIVTTEYLQHTNIQATHVAHNEPSGWSQMLKNWKAFGAKEVKLPVLPFTPTKVTSGMTKIPPKYKSFFATFLDQHNGDFVLYYADDTNRPVSIQEYSMNVGLKGTLGVYSKMGGLQTLEWKYKGYLSSLQTGRGFTGVYNQSALMKAKVYPSLGELVKIANSTIIIGK